MTIRSYPVETDNSRLTYEFISEGPNGSIQKVILFQRIQPNVYNLAFGDWNEENQEIDDNVRSNNSDLERILQTVALCVKDFLNHHKTSAIFAYGSTPARTRLYQMGISRNLTEINKAYDVYGRLKNNDWESFKKDRNYDAFYIKVK